MNRPETPSTRLIVSFYVVLAVILLGCSHYLGSDGPSQHQEAENTAAEVADREQEAAYLHAALAQHQAERPDLWTAETKERARIAAGLVAQGVQP